MQILDLPRSRPSSGFDFALYPNVLICRQKNLPYSNGYGKQSKFTDSKAELVNKEQFLEIAGCQQAVDIVEHLKLFDVDCDVKYVKVPRTSIQKKNRQFDVKHYLTYLLEKRLNIAAKKHYNELREIYIPRSEDVKVYASKVRFNILGNKCQIIGIQTSFNYHLFHQETWFTWMCALPHNHFWNQTTFLFFLHNVFFLPPVKNKRQFHVYCSNPLNPHQANYIRGRPQDWRTLTSKKTLNHQTQKGKIWIPLFHLPCPISSHLTQSRNTFVIHEFKRNN